MRSYAPHLLALAAGLFVLPASAHATGIPFFGPIVPPLAAECAAGFDSLIQMVNNAVAFALTMAIIAVAPLSFAYAGFLMVVNPTALGDVSKAKSILTNTIVGIVIALAAWLVVDAVLTALTNRGLTNWTTGLFGDGSVPCLPINTTTLNQAQIDQIAGQGSCPGNLSCSADGRCLPPPSNCGGTTCDSGQVCGSDGQTCVYPAGVACGGTTCNPNYTCNASTNTCVPPPSCTPAGQVPLDQSGTGPCNPSLVQSDSSNGPYHTFTSPQAQAMACIAKYESTCGTTNPPYNLNYSWNKAGSNGFASTAAGPFQVLLSKNSSCYDNAVCESAGGTPGTPLNCKSAFDAKGFTKTDAASQAVLARCEQAAANVACSVVAASCVFAKQGYGAWTGNVDSTSGAQACVTQYDLGQ